MNPFWEVPAEWLTTRVGSCVVEMIGGLLLATILHFLVDGWFLQFLLCQIASVLYEGEIDPNGWSWTDVFQRTAGILLGLGLWAWLR